MSKVIQVETCWDCPYLRLTAFSQGGFECKQNTRAKTIVESLDAEQWKEDGFIIPYWCPLPDTSRINF